MKASEMFNEMRKLVGEENLIDSCSAAGCRVYLTNIPSDRIIVNVDRMFNELGVKGKRCDKFLLFANLNEDILVIVLMELKSGHFNANDVSEQLQSSANFISGLVPKHYATACIPILFHGKGLHKAQSTDLKRAEIRFRGEKIPIRFNKCGAPKNLADILSQANLLP